MRCGATQDSHELVIDVKTNIHTYIYTSVYVPMYIHTNAYLCIFTRTHTQPQVLAPHMIFGHVSFTLVDVHIDIYIYIQIYMYI